MTRRLCPAITFFIAALLAGSPFAAPQDAAAQRSEARPMPRIVITARRMTDAEKARDAELERRQQSQAKAQPGGVSGGLAGPAARQIVGLTCSDC
ncbi:hypothetical protein [Noviherbaspirillum galbum]|uniref:Uncharacterized protein n=1 Tax=Noviherbaspirillum galbum TaxID=2709383 RepID=A0A6B3SLM7_9BURK|nr:hypothetical protein [Noviherbaspirillum galbum]NEX61713.1 hypothetical protein [Noviherbaspirillum galbum]